MMVVIDGQDAFQDDLWTSVALHHLRRERSTANFREKKLGLVSGQTFHSEIRQYYPSLPGSGVTRCGKEGVSGVDFSYAFGTF